MLKDKKLDDKLVTLQATYDALFIDNSIEFEYKGFQSQDEKSKFEEEFREIIKIIAEDVKGKYEVENKIDMKKLSSIFNFIEDLYINGDEKLKNLIGVSVIEALCLEPDFNYNRVHPYIGKVTKKEFDRMLNR